jgi:hypothetical protein
MSNIFYGGRILMKADEYISFDEDVYEASEYPFEEPTVFLNGHGEDWSPQDGYSWSDDSVILARKERVLVYTESNFTELLTINAAGDVVWLNSREDPFLSYSGGEPIVEPRPATAYSAVEYDLKTLTKKKYKMVLDEETPFDFWDFDALKDFIGEERVEEIKPNQAEEEQMENLTFDELLAQSDNCLNGDASSVYVINDDELPF